MADTDPHERDRHTEPDAEQRWRERGNPPSQPVSKPLAFGTWMLYGIGALIVLLIIIFLIIFHAG
jgi:hypothetical protein